MDEVISQFANNIKVATYNLHGFNQDKILLPKILQFNNIVCVQEHWLASNDIYMLAKLDETFIVYASSGMDKALCKSVLHGRPYGGVAIFVDNKIGKLCKLISKNECCIMLRVGHILLINVYMPCNNNDLYEEMLGYISNYISSQSECDSVILSGDFNLEFPLTNVLWKSFQAFLTDTKLNVTTSFLPNHGLSAYSYLHPTLNCSSLIDHFLLSDNT